MIRTRCMTWMLLIIFTLLPASSAWSQVLTADIYQAAQNRAVQQILVSARSEDRILRANALEAAEALPNRIGPLVQQALMDPQEVVRYAALVTIGKLKISGVATNARQYLNDPSMSVRAAAIFALARNFGTASSHNNSGWAVDISPLADMLMSQNPTTRGNVVYLMGLMGDASAIPLLKMAAHDRMPSVPHSREVIIRIQIAEAIYRLGDVEVLDSIRAGMFSQFDEVRILSAQMTGRLYDRQWEPAIEIALKKDPIELKLAAAGTLGRFGNRHGLDIILDAAQSRSAMLRSQAAICLGMFRNVPPATQMLIGLLTDQVESVRLAAAAGLLGGGRDGL
ncbi:MAG: HEAT repeat domain-containing protein [Phycisphaeraceae bacterium]|nr:HEAT repeat domain-containing protein [Phycisphaeraceae bacterium]